MSRYLLIRRCPSYCCVLANEKINKITDRHRLHYSAENNDQLAQPSLYLQVVQWLQDARTYEWLMKNFMGICPFLFGKQMRGEELKDLSVEELKGLEQLVERGLNRVMVMKREKIINEISALERKMANLLENAQALFAEQGRSCESVITNICSTANAPSDHEVSDISLKLGGGGIMQSLYSFKH
ncbi:Transcription factor, K-box [Dillenia turbinata]|uniref:Transcription factor, K-box n=1 Tax=Dillenia turbinata TaxID=194707 RepID=A0AAN8WGZ5_9MAGN